MSRFEPREVITVSQLVLAVLIPVYFFAVRPYVARQLLRIRVGEIRVEMLVSGELATPSPETRIITGVLDRLEGEPRSAPLVRLVLGELDWAEWSQAAAHRSAIEDACRRYENGVWPLSGSVRSRPHLHAVATPAPRAGEVGPTRSHRRPRSHRRTQNYQHPVNGNRRGTGAGSSEDPFRRLGILSSVEGPTGAAPAGPVRHVSDGVPLAEWSDTPDRIDLTDDEFRLRQRVR